MKRIPLLKETVDNALDFMEKEAPRLIKKYGSFVPELKVIVTKESNYLRIRILNSDCETSGFTGRSYVLSLIFTSQLAAKEINSKSQKDDYAQEE